MFDIELVQEILQQVLTAGQRIKRRSEGIGSPDDFLSSDEGIVNGVRVKLNVTGRHMTG